MEDTEGKIIQYVPFMSFVDPSFWHSLTDMKLNFDKLNDTSKQIFGRYNYLNDINAVFEVDGTSFNSTPQEDLFYINVTGTIINKNTIEEFKNIDKVALIKSTGLEMWQKVTNKNWIKNPSCLLNFLILSFADLKKFNYYYWFAFPTPSQPTVYLKQSCLITSQLDKNEMDDILGQHKALDITQKNFFIVCKYPKITVKCLTDVFNSTDENQTVSLQNLSNMYFSFADPSNGENPGWPLRLFIAALMELCPDLKNAQIQVLSLRYKLHSIENSVIYTVKIPENIQSSKNAGWVGWERNDRGNFGPKLVNMSASMDPVVLADTSSDLNVKLMKWRLVPELNFDVMKETKCLLLGAGTLGCHVARNLLAWGFRQITFVDSGNVSYSNPTRQVLFNHTDCLAGGKKKAEAAADNLKLILPTVQSQGIPLHIPMPGHPVGESLRAETVATIEKLTALIENHDAIFLLLDTREARWLPTLISAHYGKIVINAALGFDSYLVIRHGVTAVQSPSGDLTSSEGCYRGSQLGCYFCNDVTAPGNSVKDRTLDQQCTVTRPGAAAMAGALAVEILVGLLQHPLRVEAPATSNNQHGNDDVTSEIQGVFGPIPHSIRGFLHSYEHVLLTCPKFKQCIACSDTVVHKYREDGIEFVLRVCDSAKYLEDVTGLSALHLAAEMTDVLTFSDEEDSTID